MAIVSPEAMPGRCSFLAASSPACSSVVVASTADEKYGAHSRARPISSSTTVSSTKREALAAELLGDDQALEAQLVGHLAPHGGVVALVGVHQATDLGLGRLALEELAGDAAELFLLLGEGEVHGPGSSGGAERSVATEDVYACVHCGPWSRSAPGSCGPTWPPPLRQAGAGERVVITVDGRPVAQLGPLEPIGRARRSRSWRRPGSSSRRAAGDPVRAPHPTRRRHRASTSASTASSPRSAAE